VRDDLGVDPRLADPAGDQLGVLRTEVDHQDQIVFHHENSLVSGILRRRLSSRHLATLAFRPTAPVEDPGRVNARQATGRGLVSGDSGVVLSEDGRRLRPVKSLMRALDLLQALADSGRPLGVSELASLTSSSKTAAYNVMTTLEIRGLVRRDPQHRYVLGWGLYELGELVRHGSDLNDAARPVVAELAESTGETALLGVLEQDSVIYVEKAESRRSIRMVEAPGQRLPLHTTAAGLVLLAFASEKYRERYLATAATSTSSSEPDIRQMVADIVARGAAVSVLEPDPDLASVSVPVFGRVGEISAALTLAGPVSRLSDLRINEFLPHLMASADLITKSIGGRRPS